MWSDGQLVVETSPLHSGQQPSDSSYLEPFVETLNYSHHHWAKFGGRLNEPGLFQFRPAGGPLPEISHPPIATVHREDQEERQWFYRF